MTATDNDPMTTLRFPGQPGETLHHGIDLASAARLDIQRLRRRLADQDGLTADLDRLEETIVELGGLLLQLRDGTAHGTDSASRT